MSLECILLKWSVSFFLWSFLYFLSFGKPLFWRMQWMHSQGSKLWQCHYQPNAEHLKYAASPEASVIFQHHITSHFQKRRLRQKRLHDHGRSPEVVEYMQRNRSHLLLSSMIWCQFLSCIRRIHSLYLPPQGNELDYRKSSATQKLSF